jgi:hypothetical protein
MKIEIDKYEYKALRRIFAFADDEKALKCEAECEDCSFRILEDVEDGPFWTERKEYCAVDLVRHMIEQIEEKAK